MWRVTIPRGVHHLRDGDCRFAPICDCVMFEAYAHCPVDCRGGWIIREELLRAALREVRSLYPVEDDGLMERALAEAFFAIDAAARATE